MTKPTRESLLERVNAFLDLHGGHFDHPELPIMLDLHEYLTQEPYVVETVEDRDARIARFGAFIVDQVRALWPHEETPREVAEYIENALVYNARWKEFVDPTPATQPVAPKRLRDPIDLAKFVVSEAWCLESEDDPDLRAGWLETLNRVMDSRDEDTPDDIISAIADAVRLDRKYRQPTASEPVRIPYEFTEAQVDQAFRNFIDSFNGDEAGDVEHVRDLAGNSGFAAVGGNDMRAVFEKARAALTAAAKEGENRWTVVPDGDDLRITHSDFPGWYWHRSKVLDGSPVAIAADSESQ